MKTRGILMTGPNVQRIYADLKTQTRRVMKPQPVRAADGIWDWSPHGRWAGAIAKDGSSTTSNLRCPYGVVGDGLYVKEAWARFKGNIFFRAEGSNNTRIEEAVGWTSPLFLRKDDARLWLQITDIRVERVQDISEEDAKAEGASPAPTRFGPYRNGFRELWDSINAKKAPWASNPWVWAITFNRIDKPGAET